MRSLNFPFLSLGLCLAAIGGGAGAQTVPPRGNVALGDGAGSPVTGEFNTAIGTSAGQEVSGDRNVAIGVSAGQLVSGDDNITIGTSAGQGVSASRTIAIGSSSRAMADGAIAFGTSANATGSNSVALGTGSSDGGQANVVAVGSIGNARRIINLEAGSLASGSTDAVNGSQLFTTNQNVAAAQTSADLAGVAALVAQGTADRANTGLAQAAVSLGGGASYDGITGVFQGPFYTVGGTSYGDVASALTALDNDIATSDTFAVRYDNAQRTSILLGSGPSGPGGQPVAITNLAAGQIDATSTDAVNGAQLFATNTKLLAAQAGSDRANAGIATMSDTLGAGASYDPVTGQYLGPTYSLSVGSLTDVGSALTALDAGLVAASAQAANAIQYDNPARTSATLGGAGASPVGLANLAAGSLNATSTDAVNGSQLFATNQQVAANTTDIAALTGNLAASSTAITNLGNAIADGTIGLVQQAGGAPGAGAISIGAGTGGTVVDVAGTSGPRSVNGVAAATLSAGSTQAVNGAQLHATNQQVAAAQASAAQANGGVAALAVALGGGATFDTASGAFAGPSYSIAGGVQTDVGSALAALDNALSGIDAVASNAVLYDDASHASITLGGAGTSPVALANVAAGGLSASSSDAVNGAQLHATNQNVAQNSTAIASNAAATAALGAAIGQGTIGLVQQVGGAANGQITIGAATGGTSLSVAGTSGARTVSGVAAGSVAQGSTDAVNGGQLFALSQQLGLGLGTVTGRLDAIDNRIGQLNFDLRRFHKDASSGIATAVALGALPQSTNPGRWALGMGTGLREGQLAIAAGASWRSPNDAFVVNLRAGYDQAAFTAGAGFGMEF